MIELTDLSVGYPGVPVLSHVDLTLPEGQITVLAGPNGCGKSTLLKAIAGIHPHTAGSVHIRGEDIRALSPNQLARLAAYLPQNRPVPDITALRMVLHGRFPYLSYPRRYRQEDLNIARACLARMGIADLADCPMHTLSGGTRQKVYLAMALAQDTPVILMDEPTTFLDLSHQLRTMEQAALLAREGKTVVMVLHDLSMALQTAHQLAVFHQGRLVQSGTPEEVFCSGCLETVFGVPIRRFSTGSGWQYYYEMPGREPV